MRDCKTWEDPTCKVEDVVDIWIANNNIGYTFYSFSLPHKLRNTYNISQILSTICSTKYPIYSLWATLSYQYIKSYLSLTLHLYLQCMVVAEAGSAECLYLSKDIVFKEI